MNLLAAEVIDLDDLDLSHCVVGPGLVVRIDGLVTVYRRRGHTVEIFGVFDGPASAFTALDAADRSAAGAGYATP